MKYLLIALIYTASISTSQAIVCPATWTHDFKATDGSTLEPARLSFKLYNKGKVFYTVKNGKQIKLGYAVWGKNAKCYACQDVTMRAFYKNISGAIVGSAMSNNACPINPPVFCK